MKFQVERDVLAEAVAWAARSLSPRPPLPVLSGLLITAENNEVSIASFDYEISARLTIAADVHEEGTILVSGRLLNEICASLPAATVSVETDGSKVNLNCRQANFSLATMPVSEYPELPDTPEVIGRVDAHNFAQAINQISIAASRDDTLPTLTSVKLEFEADLITMLATDRYRLGLKELSWQPDQTDLSTEALVKAKTLTDVARSLGTGGQISISLSDNADLIAFESGGRWITSSLVDGDYPKIRSLFPENSPIHALVNTAELTEAVKRVALVAERNSPIRLIFSDGQVTLDAGAGDDASASEVVPAQLEGEDIAVGFNPSYLRDGLGALSTDHVRFSFTSAPKPVMLTGQNEADAADQQSYRYLVMPVRLS